MIHSIILILSCNYVHMCKLVNTSMCVYMYIIMYDLKIILHTMKNYKLSPLITHICTYVMYINILTVHVCTTH